MRQNERHGYYKINIYENDDFIFAKGVYHAMLDITIWQ